MKALGIKGEDIAIAYLKRKGYCILNRNYKTPYGEVDIITKDNDTIVFVEVKSRSTLSYGEPFESVDYRKQERLRKSALFYLKSLKQERAVRFDVISILLKNGEHEIRHIKEAF
ncbi:MAG: YraN family protein [Thermodesulfovibrionales bacterium]|nr:YraN family protein [Thermodesulfovibrionales bacterium]